MKKINKRNERDEELDEMKDNAIDFVCEKAEQVVKECDISDPCDIECLRDDMERYSRMCDAIDMSDKTSSIEKILAKNFTAAEIRKIIS